MAIGPVHLIVLGFEHSDFHGGIFEELAKVRESDTVRVIDSLAVQPGEALVGWGLPASVHRFVQTGRCGAWEGLTTIQSDSMGGRMEEARSRRGRPIHDRDRSLRR